MKTSSGDGARAYRYVIEAAVLIICGSMIFLSLANTPSKNASTGATAAAEADSALILENANSNENIYNSATGDFISHLRGDVIFRYDDVRITADEAHWRRSEGIVDFANNITVDHRGQIMTCDRLRFVRSENVLTASGNVFYQDSARVTFIRGETAEYATNTKEAVLSGNPLLTRIDSSNAEIDTIFLRGRFVRYNDSLKIATVTHDVSVTRGSLVATGQTGRFFADENRAILRIDPVIYYEGHRVVGDSVDLFLGKEKLESAIVVGNAHGLYRDAADSTADTTTTNIWSDSLHLSMSETGKISVMKAIGNARGDYSEINSVSKSVTTTNFSSDSMHIFMFETGKISVMKAFGGAKGDYSEINSSSNNVAETVFSSDSMQMLMFETGKINVIKAFGNARGKYSEISMPPQISDSTLITAQRPEPDPITDSITASVPITASDPTFVSAPLGRTPNSAVTTNISSDSMHIFMFETGKVRAMRAFGNTHGRSAEWSASSQTKDSSITHIWSDSLRVAMTDAGKIRTMRAFSGDTADVRSVNFTVGDSARANEITGKRMTLLFSPTGKIENAVVTGDAKSLYHLEESDGGGINRASGDRILVTFSAGKARKIRVIGNVKGFYAP